MSFRRRRWQAISPIAIDVNVPWSVCFSRSCMCSAQTAEDIVTISFAYDTVHCIVAYIGQPLPP